MRARPTQMTREVCPNNAACSPPRRNAALILRNFTDGGWEVWWFVYEEICAFDELLWIPVNMNFLLITDDKHRH